MIVLLCLIVLFKGFVANDGNMRLSPLIENI